MNQARWPNSHSSGLTVGRRGPISWSSPTMSAKRSRCRTSGAMPRISASMRCRSDSISRRCRSTNARCLIQGIISRSLAPISSIGWPAIFCRIALNEGARIFPVAGDHVVCSMQTELFAPVLLRACQDVAARGLAGKPITCCRHRAWHRPIFRDIYGLLSRPYAEGRTRCRAYEIMRADRPFVEHRNGGQTVAPSQHLRAQGEPHMHGSTDPDFTGKRALA